MAWLKVGRLAGREGMSVEFVFHTRGDDMQPRPGAGLSTYWLFGFKQIILHLSFSLL